ncbi:MAG TPA: biopolymer transporter ExbD [Isosphaeraceae bacterium]|nr:biopolymer transporter ExbD [Isosphaeraceae bacterium]
MSWKVRHEGSPRSIDGLGLTQVLEGLRVGQWEPTDEVMGPTDQKWIPLEDHPQLAETVADLEPPPPKKADEETRLDMNPLIDVAMVLLIFFILTTSYDSIRKVIEAPTMRPEGTGGRPRPRRIEDIQNLMVRVEARKGADGKATIKVDDRVVAEKDLETTLGRYVTAPPRRTQLLLDAVGVDWGTLVFIQDAAKSAGMDKVFYLRQRTAPEEPKRP